MKQKLFTLLTLLLTVCSGAWAQDFTYALSLFTVTNTTYTYEFSSENALKNKTAWVEVPSSASEGTITFKGSADKADRFLYIYKTNGTIKDETRRIVMNSSWPTAINFTSSDIKSNEGKYYLVFSTTDDFKTKGVKYTLTDPSGLEISPASGTYAGNVSVTMSANDGYTIYYTDNGSEPTKSSTIYAGSFDVTSNKAIKAIAYKGEDHGFIQTAEYVIVPENRKYDFTALTSGDLTALQGNTDAFSDDTSNKIISNKVQWNSNTDYALEGSDGTDISVAQYLLFGRSENNIKVGDFKYYYGDSKYVYYNNSNTYVKIPGVNAGQKVILEMSAGTGRDISATNTTVSKLSYTASGVKKLTFIASANGEVKLSFSGNLFIYSIEVKTPVYYTVTYNLNGGTGTLPTETDKEEGDKFDLHDGTTGITAPDGKVFDGWNDGTSTYAGGAEYTMGDANVTLTAQWRIPALKHHVTYVLNGGTGTAPTQEDVEEGANFEVASGTTGITAPDGKIFSTWNDGTTDYAPGDSYPMGTSDVTLTAQWANLYTITYDKGTYGAGSISNGQKTEGVKFTLSSEIFTRDGYVQTGWATTDGGAKAFDLGGSYTTNAAITLYPVWSKSNTYTAVFSYDSEHPDAAPAGWTFSNAKTYGNTDATVAYEGAFGATFPGTGDCKNDNYIAFAKNASVYAKYDLGSAKTVTAVTGTFYVGSSNARTFTITYLGEDESVKHTITVNHPADSNWGEDDVNEVATVSNVRYIKINGMTSNQSWIVMSAFSVSTLYSEYVSVNTNTGRNYGTMVTPAGKKLDFAAVSDDVKAYISPGLNDGKDAISIQSVSVVPANTPIIIKTTAQGTTVSVPVTEEAADDVASINKLVAGDGTTDATPGTYTYYYIASDQFHRATSGTLTSGKAYLKLETATLARDIYGFDEGGETTAINKVEAKKVENGVYYNLAGQQVAQPTKGLYIVNGKKVVLK